MKKKMVIALAGNPNSGKTTVFNALTGAKQRTGNWPGVTVEKKEGEFEYNGIKIRVVDLPGTYALSSYSIDERIARDFLVKEKPDIVVVIVDSSNLERNLYLVIQLLELGQRVIMALNMIDIAEKNGFLINAESLGKILGVVAVKTIASKGEGIEELKKAIVDYKPPEKRFYIRYGKRLEKIVEEIEENLNTAEFKYPLRFVVSKIVEGDPEFMDILENLPNKNEIYKLLKEAEDIAGGDLPTYVAERRYGFIHGLFEECVTRRSSFKERVSISDKIDRVLTNRWLGIPLFLFFIWLTFQLVFTVGGPFADWIDTFFGWLGDKTGILLTNAGVAPWFISLVTDGIIAGVGSVLVFFPNIFILFLAFAVLEDSGYMARAAFVMDRLMHALGLHGKSFIPMILGFGCNVPAIMATRTLESRKDRILTILINPLISCSARLPIYILFAGTFFPKNRGMIIFSLYLLGIVLAILVARIFKSIFFKREAAPLIMELPPYHIPTIKGVFLSAWNRSSMFLKKAGTIIFLAVVGIWLLAALPPGVDYGSKASLVGRLGSVFAPLFKPAGFGFWQASVALIFGILAKEVVVGTLGTLFGGEEQLSGALLGYFTPLSAYAFMIMSLIYIPCIAAIATIKQEAGWKWAGFAVGYSLVLGWLVAVLFYQIGRLFTG